VAFADGPVEHAAIGAVGAYQFPAASGGALPEGYSPKDKMEKAVDAAARRRELRPLRLRRAAARIGQSPCRRARELPG
jgi:hypothetical protein